MGKGIKFGSGGGGIGDAFLASGIGTADIKANRFAKYNYIANTTTDVSLISSTYRERVSKDGNFILGTYVMRVDGDGAFTRLGSIPGISGTMYCCPIWFHDDVYVAGYGSNGAAYLTFFRLNEDGTTTLIKNGVGTNLSGGFIYDIIPIDETHLVVLGSQLYTDAYTIIELKADYSVNRANGIYGPTTFISTTQSVTPKTKGLYVGGNNFMVCADYGGSGDYCSIATFKADTVNMNITKVNKWSMGSGIGAMTPIDETHLMAVHGSTTKVYILTHENGIVSNTKEYNLSITTPAYTDYLNYCISKVSNSEFYILTKNVYQRILIPDINAEPLFFKYTKSGQTEYSKRTSVIVSGGKLVGIGNTIYHEINDESTISPANASGTKGVTKGSVKTGQKGFIFI